MLADQLLLVELDPPEVTGDGRLGVDLILKNRTEGSITNLCLQLSGDNNLRILGQYTALSGIALAPQDLRRVPLNLHVRPGNHELRLHSISLRLNGHPQRLPDINLMLVVMAPPVSIQTPKCTPSKVHRVQSMVPPFKPYTGTEPYAFVSYSHKDKGFVYPEILRLHQEGFRIWYDEGIVPGTDCHDGMAKGIDGATCFLVFISPNAVVSEYVKNEIHHALDLEKRFLAIHLKETKLEGGLKLRMNRHQYILRYEMSIERFSEKLFDALPAVLRRSPNE